MLKDPRGLTQALHAGATIGLTEARITLNGLEAADDVIENFIWHYPESPYLEEMFRRLDGIYAQEDNPSDSELRNGRTKARRGRRRWRSITRARMFQRQGRQEKAIGAYTDFIQRFPRHPLAFDAWMQLGQLYLDTNRIPTAISAFEGAMRRSDNATDRARGEIATGDAYFAQGEYLLAARILP